MEYKMQLTQEEIDILNGSKGETMAKVIKSLILYGDAFGATRFVPVSGKGHIVTSFGISILHPVFSLMDELIDAGLKVEAGFTADPKPVDHLNVKSNFLEKFIFDKKLYGLQEKYEGQLEKLGLESRDSFSCTCYMDEMGNIPEKGQILSWAESSAVVYANSVIGARCNRNSGIIEMFGSILGKVPEFDLLTDEGRKAKWIVEVKTKELPEAQVLGSAIGMKVMEDVPFIKGLDRFLGTELNNKTKAYLKDMGAATASNGAVGLYHVENLTPEAVEQGTDIINEDAQVYVIDEAELERVKNNYPNIWKKPDAKKPSVCFIGCPHLSFEQLCDWTDKFEKELAKQGKKKVKLNTIMTAAPAVLARFKKEKKDLYEKLTSFGIHLSHICPLMYMSNPLCKIKPVITNSNKLRTYTTARYFTDAEITTIAVKGGLE